MFEEMFSNEDLGQVSRPTLYLGMKVELILNQKQSFITQILFELWQQVCIIINGHKTRDLIKS